MTYNNRWAIFIDYKKNFRCALSQGKRIRTVRLKL